MRVFRTVLFITALVSFTTIANAQKQFNPQIGLSFQDLSKPDSGYAYKPAMGWLVGMDARFGKGFYFQPGMFYVSNETEIETTSKTEKANLTTNSLRAKTYAGWNMINWPEFKLRLNAGFSYDFLLSMKDDVDDADVFTKEDYNTVGINGGLGVGVDLLVFSVEVGLNTQLNKTFKTKEYTPDSKATSYYLTIGFVIGDGLHKNK